MNKFLSIRPNNAFVDDGCKQQFLKEIELAFKMQGDELVVGLYDWDRGDTNKKGRCMRTHLNREQIKTIAEFFNRLVNDNHPEYWDGISAYTELEINKTTGTQLTIMHEKEIDGHIEIWEIVEPSNFEQMQRNLQWHWGEVVSQ